MRARYTYLLGQNNRRLESLLQERDDRAELDWRAPRCYDSDSDDDDDGITVHIGPINIHNKVCHSESWKREGFQSF